MFKHVTQVLARVPFLLPVLAAVKFLASFGSPFLFVSFHVPFNLTTSSSNMTEKDPNHSSPPSLRKDGLEQEEVENEPSTITEVDPTIEKRITRKYDLHVIPWLFGIW